MTTVPPPPNNNNNHNKNNNNWEHLESDDEDHTNLPDGRRHGRRQVHQFVQMVKTVVQSHWNNDPHQQQDDSEDASAGASSSSSSKNTHWLGLSTMMRNLKASKPSAVPKASSLLAFLAVIAVLLPAYGLYRRADAMYRHAAQQEALWKEQWQRMQDENKRLQQQEEALRLEMELLQEEAAVAMARASSLAREQEKWRILHGEEEEPSSNQKQNEEEGKSYEYFFFDDDENDCHQDDSSFTFLDNCWIKAKANVKLGHCGDGTRDFFKDLWQNLWTNTVSFYWDWDAYLEDTYAMEPYTGRDNDDDASACSGDANEDCHDVPNRNEDRIITNPNYYGDDTYYPDHDPLANLFTAIQSAGQSFSNRLTKLMSDEEANTSKSTASDLEDAIQQGFSQASAALSEAMAATKKDMQALSKDALETLSAAVTSRQEKQQQKQQHKPMAVTRKGLFDAASALSSLTQTWHEAVASMSEGTVKADVHADTMAQDQTNDQPPVEYE